MVLLALWLTTREVSRWVIASVGSSWIWTGGLKPCLPVRSSSWLDAKVYNIKPFGIFIEA